MCPGPMLGDSDVVDLRYGLGGGIFKSPLRDSHVQLEPMATAIDILKCVQNIFKVIH